MLIDKFGYSPNFSMGGGKLRYELNNITTVIAAAGSAAFCRLASVPRILSDEL
jgi:hypothetical protein